MLCLRVNEEVSLVVHWLDKVQLFMADWVRVVVLHWFHDVDEVNFRALPVVVLMTLMIRFGNVMVIRSPEVL